MLILIIGFLALISGLVMMRNTELDSILRKTDEAEWKTVMRPSPSGYVNSFGMIPLFSWTLNRGYEKSASAEVRAIGTSAFKRAKIAKYLMLLGVGLIAVGFYFVLLLDRL